MNEVFDKDMAVFSGLHTFHNIAFRKDLKDVDYAVVGVPFDTAAANRCGARFAPMAIRSFASFSNGYGWNTKLIWGKLPLKMVILPHLWQPLKPV